MHLVILVRYGMMIAHLQKLKAFHKSNPQTARTVIIHGPPVHVL